MPCHVLSCHAWNGTEHIHAFTNVCLIRRKPLQTRRSAVQPQPNHELSISSSLVVKATAHSHSRLAGSTSDTWKRREQTACFGGLLLFFVFCFVLCCFCFCVSVLLVSSLRVKNPWLLLLVLLVVFSFSSIPHALFHVALTQTSRAFFSLLLFIRCFLEVTVVDFPLYWLASLVYYIFPGSGIFSWLVAVFLYLFLCFFYRFVTLFLITASLFT